MRRAEALRDKIEQDIVTGRFQPGERLDEQSLADRFGVSRTPIREALMQLASTGMVELHSRRGAFVASLGLKEIIERFEAMAALEGMCGALAARRITDEQRAMLLAAHEACQNEAKNGASDPYYYANERFHQTIYEACHNTYLAEQARQLHNRLKPYRRLQLRARHRLGHARRASEDRRCHHGRRFRQSRAAASRSHPGPGGTADRLHHQLRYDGSGMIAEPRDDCTT